MMQAIVFAAALLISATLTRSVRDLAIAHGWAHIPTSDRHVHTRPIPRLGGVAIFLTLWCMALLGFFRGNEFIFPHSTFKILGPATIIFLLGLADDVWGVGAHAKFAVQAGAAVLLYFDGFGISRVALLMGHSPFSWLIGLPLTVLWVLWITNAFNLIDGLDGLAAGSALFSTVVTFAVAMLFHNYNVVFLTLVLAGAIAGFLRFNFNPASIFLGDCGSLLIGFLLSAIALAGSQKAPTAVAVAIPIVSLGLPILDVAVAVTRRFLSCKGIFQADCEHIHHKLLSKGISHRQAVLVLYGVSACFGLLSLLLLHPGMAAIATVLTAVGIGAFAGVKQLCYHEFRELGHVANRTLNQRRVIANDISIRRTSEALASCTSPAKFCRILRQCLEPAGFDGFGVHLSPELTGRVKHREFRQVRRSELSYFWAPSLTSSESNWSLTFSLQAHNGKRLGVFTLYRTNTATPLWMDLEIFTATGFSNAIALAVERELDSWFIESRKEQRPATLVEAFEPAMAGTARHRITVPTSG